MRAFQTLEIKIGASVARVWMNRPECHNAFDEVAVSEMTEAFRALEADASVRAVVLGGRGKSFSAGADVRMMERSSQRTRKDNRSDALAMARMFQSIDRLSKPTVARVHGVALGGGLGLVAACDIAVASSDAVFGAIEARLGLLPSTISPYVVAAIGTREARRYFLTGERIAASEAHRIGLVHALCAPGSLDARVEEMVAALLACGPRAQAEAKRLIDRVGRSQPDDKMVDFTADHIAAVRATPEAKEGVQAFLQKRPPGWSR